MGSKIQWTDETWNPTVGCSKVSPGCKGCYAIREARIKKYNPNPKIFKVYSDVVTGKGEPLNWTGKVKLIEERLEIPLHWRKPRRIFVNSMSDLFHEALPDEAIDRVFAVMALCPQHTFQVLTKRAERMYEYFQRFGVSEVYGSKDRWKVSLWFAGAHQNAYTTCNLPAKHGRSFPLPHVHLGVSVENQATADERIPWLLKTPAAVRFVSYEPALGPVDFTRLNILNRLRDQLAPAGIDPGEGPAWLDAVSGEWLDGHDCGMGPKLDQVIFGGESGPGARPCDLAWARSTRDQCRAAGVAFFCKQLGSNPHDRTAKVGYAPGVADGTYNIRWKLKSRKGGDMSEWPEDLRVRELPSIRQEASHGK